MQVKTGSGSGLISDSVSSSILGHNLDCPSLVEIYGLSMRFGSFLALSDLRLQVRPGEIYGLLGPNGAGKTTTIRSVLGLLEPTAGYVKVAGFNPTLNPIEVKSKVGYVAEKPAVYDSLSPRDFFEFVASVRQVEPTAANSMVSHLADAFDMSGYFDSPIATLSLGMKQKVSLVAAFMHQPPVLLLDEPLNGLDAKSCRIVKDLIRLHAQRGGATLFSTHIMEVAEQVCTRIGIVDQGRLIAEGTFEQLKSQAGSQSHTLEEVFLKLTHEESEVADTERMLREAFFQDAKA